MISYEAVKFTVYSLSFMIKKLKELRTILYDKGSKNN